MAITIKNPEEIELLREGGRRLAKILERVVEASKLGLSTWELDRLAEGLIFEYGGKPSFKGYRIKGVSRSYPCSLCVSINDEVVHAIPRKEQILREGDIVGLDIGMWWPVRSAASSFQFPVSGYNREKLAGALCTDMAVTVGVGKISTEAQKLLDATRESLEVGIRAVRPGAKIGDISFVIQQHLEKNKLGIIRDLAGHGVGYEVHEEPLIPNFGKPGTGPELKEGMVIAIEPMATLGDWRVILQDDDWTFKTADGSIAAHFEHTVAVIESGVEVLTKL